MITKDERSVICTLLLSFQALFKAGEEHFGTDEQTFITILGNRSAEHLRKGLRWRQRERDDMLESNH